MGSSFELDPQAHRDGRGEVFDVPSGCRRCCSRFLASGRRFLKEIIKSVVNNSFKSLEGWIHWRIQIRFDKNKPQERLDCGQSLIFLCQVTACPSTLVAKQGAGINEGVNP